VDENDVISNAKNEAPYPQKQILLIKEKHESEVATEKARRREAKKKKVEKKIISRLNRLLRRVEDIKRRHFPSDNTKEGDEGMEDSLKYTKGFHNMHYYSN